MGKRVVCLICAAVLVMMAFFGIRTGAAPWKGPPTPTVEKRDKGLVSHAPNPLASAMFLVLAGVGISLLFDKKDKR